MQRLGFSLFVTRVVAAIILVGEAVDTSTDPTVRTWFVLAFLALISVSVAIVATGGKKRDEHPR